MHFTKAEIFDSKRGGMSPKRSRLACARLVPRLITSWRAVHRPRCSRSPSPRRASRPSRAPGPSARGARAARRWPAGTSGAPAATGSRCAWAARARRGLSAPPPRKVRGNRGLLRGAADIARRKSDDTPGTPSPPSTRDTSRPAARHATTGPLSTSAARLGSVRSSQINDDWLLIRVFFFVSRRVCDDASESARDRRVRRRLTREYFPSITQTPRLPRAGPSRTTRPRRLRERTSIRARCSLA